jgi:dihydrofolate reductase
MSFEAGAGFYGQEGEDPNQGAAVRTVVSHTFVTLDCVAVVDAAIGTIAELRDTKEVLDHFFGKVAEEDAMLLGRVTYEEWAGYWPTSTNEPFASHINNVPKFVVSRSLDAAPWPGHEDAAVIDGDLVEAVTDLKAQPGGNIGVHGSPTLVDALLRADLLDEMRLEIYPVLEGKGPRLFTDGPPKRLELAGSTTTSNGVVILTYRRRE